MGKKVIIITGPTASGKTALAVQLSKDIQGEIISADSRQVFRKMDIGTGKDLSEYGNVPYHLIDILNPNDEFSVSQFQKLALQSITDIISRGRVPIICGGTGHYIKALIENYPFNEDSTNRQFTEHLEQLGREDLYHLLKKHGLWKSHHWKQDSKRRIARAIEKAQKGEQTTPTLTPGYHYSTRIYFTKIERHELRKKIKKRLRERLDEGMIDEVTDLIQSGVSHDRLKRLGLEYKWILSFLSGVHSYTEMEKNLYTAICRFAKRQVTFLRYLEKAGHHLRPISSYQSLYTTISGWLS